MISSGSAYLGREQGACSQQRALVAVGLSRAVQKGPRGPFKSRHPEVLAGGDVVRQLDASLRDARAGRATEYFRTTVTPKEK